MKMKVQILFCLLLSSAAYSQSANNFKTDYSPSLEKAHPVAKQLMNEEFYFNLTDITAPFGSDDGNDAYAGFKDWRETNKTGNPKNFLLQQIEYWGYPIFDLYELDTTKLNAYLSADKSRLANLTGIDQAVIAVAFGQLYLEGTIDKDFKELAKIAINRELLPEILNHWPPAYVPERESKLRKMLAVLSL